LGSAICRESGKERSHVEEENERSQVEEKEKLKVELHEKEAAV